jgi:hypothetical protein
LGNLLARRARFIHQKESREMEETILSWNVTNWITVVLMAAVGFLVIGTVATLIHKASAGNSGSQSA